MLGVRIDPKTSNYEFTYSQVQYDRQVRFRSVTPNGIVFYEEPGNINGYDFYLFITKDTSKAEISKARSYLYNQRDVATFSLSYPE
jgi:hypothetical protein